MRIQGKINTQEIYITSDDDGPKGDSVTVSQYGKELVVIFNGLKLTREKIAKLIDRGI